MKKSVVIIGAVVVMLGSVAIAGKVVRVKCCNCNGSGSVVVTKHCPSCGGAGMVQTRCGAGCRLIDYTPMLGPTPIYDGNPNTFYGFSMTQPCSNCGGSGKVRTACPTCKGIARFQDRVRCSNCNGNGAVAVDVSSW